MNQLVCPACEASLSPDTNFCPKCGVKIQEVILSVSFGKQISIYLLSLFLPPFGLWPGIKYLRQKEQKARTVGTVAIILTVVSTILSLWFGVAIYHQFTQVYSSQLNQYMTPGL